MNYLVFLFSKALLYSLSYLPFWVLHRLSGFIYVMLRYVIRYRKKVILSNLNRCFPDKSRQEITRICNAFYRHFADIIIESLKGFTISADEIRKRHRLVNPELVGKYVEQGKNVLLVGNHYNNWEFFAFSLNMIMENNNPVVLGIYSKLANPFMNKMVCDSRARMGSQLVWKKEAFKIVDEFQKPFFVCFAADQNPKDPLKAYWMKFLGQDTAVFYGVERMAKKFDLPVIYARVSKVKRSHYEITFELITEQPVGTPYGEITEAHMRKLEEDLKKQPEYWLWSHKRWKGDRPENYDQIRANYAAMKDGDAN